MNESDFLATLVEDPDDIGAWLVYADWLEERGDPRGSYLHANIALDRDDPERERRTELFEQLKWLEIEHGDLSGLGRSRSMVSEWRYGLAMSVRGTTGRLLGVAEELVRHPITGIRVQSVDHSTTGFGDWPQFRAVRSVRFHVPARNRPDVWDAQNRHLSDLLQQLGNLGPLGWSMLELHTAEIDRTMFARLTALPCRLRELEITNCSFDLRLLARLVEAPFVQSLEAVQIEGFGEVEDLAPLRSIPTLREFRNRYGRFDNDDLRALLPGIRVVS